MPDFINGLDLSEGFFREAAQPVIEAACPGLIYTAGLLGYGSDVIGLDDEVSSDHLWGPRFYLFLRPEDMGLRDGIFRALSAGLPREYRGYSVHFGGDAEGNGVRSMEAAPESGGVSPLVWIDTVDGFIAEYLGGRPESAADWLAISEHKLLGFTSGRLFVDGLGMEAERAALARYPMDVRMFLIASQWSLIAEERAFVRRCGDRGDELGSRLCCARIADRLMRLCFLYRGRYAPYSKWFGTAFNALDVPDALKEALHDALAADRLDAREDAIVSAQAQLAALHNDSGLARAVDIQIGQYYTRKIKVIDADALCESALNAVSDAQLRRMPPIGKLGEVGNLVRLTDDARYRAAIAGLYRAASIEQV